MLAYNGPLATAFAFWASVSIQRALPSTTVSLSYLAVPACGLIVSTLWLGESLPVTLILGGVLIILGVAAILTAGGVAFNRMNVVLFGMTLSGAMPGGTPESYVPSAVEWAISIGLFRGEG